MAPDFSISNDASAITDLIEWSNCHPEPDQEGDDQTDEHQKKKEGQDPVKDDEKPGEEKGAVDIVYELNEEMILPMQNPKLRRQFYRRGMLQSAWATIMKDHEKARIKSAHRSLIRISARKYEQKTIRQHEQKRGTGTDCGQERK